MGGQWGPLSRLPARTATGGRVHAHGADDEDRLKRGADNDKDDEREHGRNAKDDVAMPTRI